MILHRSALFLLLLVSALIASCAVDKPAPSPIAASGGQGIYKVGLPYEIDGTWYYPGTNYAYDDTGMASSYGQELRGRLTANGEIFDPESLTAAHPTLPMPSIVQVTNLENGRSVNLRVNDRGPYGSGSIIAVSRGVARVLGFEAQGNAKVRVKILALESVQAALLAMRNGSDSVIAGERAEREEAMRPASRTAKRVPPPARKPVAASAPTGAGVQGKPRPVYIQAAAFAQSDNAMKARRRLHPLGLVMVATATANGADLYRVRLGPFAKRSDADRLLRRVVGAGFGDAHIVVN
jgi:rare lipoprotein A